MQITNLFSPHILTADIGGSHITAAIFNTKTNNILPQSVSRVDLLSNGSASEILAAWSSGLKKALNDTGLQVSGLSVAMPGPFDYQNGVCYIKGLDKYEALYGMNIKQYLVDLFAFAPQQVIFRNDAESTVAGEVLKGAGKKFKKVIGVTLGTGFGSAFSENKVTTDINLGSHTYKETIADDYFSTRWLLKRYHELTGLSLPGGVKELAEMAAKSAVAQSIFNEFGSNMGEFLSGTVKQFNPEAVILCGNIAKASEHFIKSLARSLNSLPIKLAQLGEMAPLIGAATLFDDLEGSKHYKSATKL